MPGVVFDKSIYFQERLYFIDERYLQKYLCVKPVQPDPADSQQVMTGHINLLALFFIQGVPEYFSNVLLVYTGCPGTLLNVKMCFYLVLLVIARSPRICLFLLHGMLER